MSGKSSISSKKIKSEPVGEEVNKGWEERFDKLCMDSFTQDGGPYWPDWDEVKRFIKNLVSHSRQDLIGEIEELADDWADNNTPAAVEWHMSQPPLESVADVNKRRTAIEDFLGFLKHYNLKRK